MQVHLSGAFPRSEQLIQTTRLAARGRASSKELLGCFTRDTQSVISLQVDCGLDFVVDGQQNWQDLFRPFPKLFTGLKTGSLTRWFDNNTFYRKPVVVGSVDYNAGSAREYCRFDLFPNGVAKKAIIPGPFTFAKLSENVHYPKFSDLLDDIAHAIKDLALELSTIGCQCIQFNEPGLCHPKTTEAELDQAHQAYETCATGLGSKVGLQTYFADASPFISRLLDFAVDYLGIDFYSTSVDSVGGYDFDLELACGCIDGRNSLVESAEELVRLIRGLETRLAPKSLSATTNCDLDFLPYSIAEKKVRRLGELKRRIE